MMKKVIAVLLVVITLAVASAEDRTVHIGLILPLTGPGADYGHHLRQGAELATSGNPRVKLVFEDDHLDAAAAVTAYRKLRSAHQIDAVVVFGSQSARAIVPLTERDGVLSLSITTDSRVLLGSRFAVRIAMGAVTQASALISHMKQRGLQKVALIGTTHEAMLENLSSFKSMASSEGLSVVWSEDYTRGETDFKTHITRLLAVKPDAVVSTLLPPSFSAFAKQLRQQNPTTTIVGFVQSENRSEIHAAQGALENLIFATVPLSPHFVTEYQSRFGEVPLSYACYTFDFMQMLAALNTYRSDEAAGYLRSLKNYSGACGTYSSTPDFAYDLSAKLVRVEGDSFKDIPATEG